MQQLAGFIPMPIGLRLSGEFDRDGDGGPVLQVHNFHAHKNQVGALLIHLQGDGQVGRMRAARQEQNNSDRQKRFLHMSLDVLGVDTRFSSRAARRSSASEDSSSMALRVISRAST